MDFNWHIQELWKRDQDRQDHITHADITITHAHHETHAGQAYRADLTSSAADFDNTDVMIMAFDTPQSSKAVHLIIQVTVTNSSTLVFFEGATVTATTPAGNSVIPIYNKNRLYGDYSNVRDTYSGVAGQITGAETAIGNGPPTVAANGTTLFTEKLGSNKTKAGGESRDISEWVLKLDTTYVVKLTADTNDVVAHIALLWYEHVPGEHEHEHEHK